jgi:hypothetical protein
MAKKKAKEIEVVSTEPKVVKGSHLTVTTYPDGRTELEWDDVALYRDVVNAINSVDNRQTDEKPKKATRKKK